VKAPSRRLAGSLAVCAAAVVLAAPAAGSSERVSPRPHAFPFRYLIDSGSGQAAAAGYGWNLLDVSSKAEADALPRGTRGLVWVGDYDNTTCSWEVTDAQLRQRLAGTAGDRRIAGFFFSDEPDPYACPQAPAQHRARSQLIHSLDPGAFTVMLMDSNSGPQTIEQMPLWTGVSDYIALDPYPCYQGKPCRYGWITSVIRAANRAGLPYWGVAQAFADTTWRWPTAGEEQHMLAQWRSSQASGYMTFSWAWDGNRLSTRPDLLAVLKRFNHGLPLKASGRALAAAPAADEIHYTYTGPTSVAFDWRGAVKTLRYGRTRHYTRKVVAHTPNPLPFSSSGPFWEARLTRLAPGTTYHYSIGAGPDRTFSTAPTGPFRFDVQADVGATTDFGGLTTTEHQVAADHPAFVLVVGDLTYGNDEGQAAVDQHFDDVMVWSTRAAYMPVWGNHEWDKSTDDLRNYKGRFAIPHPQASPGAPAAGCCGQDWGWFDAGGVRFISYPEPYTDATWPDWQQKAGRVMAAAQADPKIHFIVTFGHRPAYSTGYHPGDPELASILNGFGDQYSKYVLNINGHSHDYERFQPIHHVVHITEGASGSLETPWSSTDARTAFRAMHLSHLRVQVTAGALQIQAICGSPTSHDDMTCTPGSVVDSTTIPAGGSG
jgi:Calcineurin-like phosphoesterase